VLARRRAARRVVSLSMLSWPLLRALSLCFFRDAFEALLMWLARFVSGHGGTDAACARGSILQACTCCLPVCVCSQTSGSLTCHESSNGNGNKSCIGIKQEEGRNLIQHRSGTFFYIFRVKCMRSVQSISYRL